VKCKHSTQHPHIALRGKVPAQIQSVDLPDTLRDIYTGAFQGTIGMQSMDIPDAVTAIGGNAFHQMHQANPVRIGKGVLSIGSRAFSRVGAVRLDFPKGLIYMGHSVCESSLQLEEVVMSPNLPDVPYNTFKDCAELRHVALPDAPTHIYTSAFENCPLLDDVEIPVSVTEIGAKAFYGCTSLSTLSIPAPVVEIGYRALYNCTSLQSVNVDPDNTVYQSVNGVLFDKAFTSLLLYPAGRPGAYSVPDGITRITEDSMASTTGLTTLTLPDSLLEIEQGAVSGAVSLKTVHFGNQLHTIGGLAFADGQALENLAFPNSLLTINGSAFVNNPALVSVTLPDMLDTLGPRAFQNCTSLQHITIPDTLTSIREETFKDCQSLQSVHLGSSLTHIERYAFQGCSALLSLNVPDNVTSISTLAFRDCTSLHTVRIGSGITTLQAGAFQGCTALNTLELSAELRVIEEYAFRHTGTLNENLVIPEGVTHIGSQAFLGSQVQTVSLPASLTELGDRSFGNATALTAIQIHPDNTVYHSQDGVVFQSGAFPQLAAYPSGKPDTTYVVPEGTTGILESAFRDAQHLQHLQLPSTLTTVHGEAFMFNAALETIEISPSNLNFTTIDGVLYNKAVTTLLKYPYGNPRERFNVPSTVNLLAKHSFREVKDTPDLVFPGDKPDVELVFGFQGTLEDPALARVFINKDAEGWGDRFHGLQVVIVPELQGLAPVPGGNPNDLGITVTSTPGTQVTVEKCTDLRLGDWEVLIILIMDEDGVADFIHGFEGFETAFYRFIVE
jgi:hypothetical protein